MELSGAIRKEYESEWELAEKLLKGNFVKELELRKQLEQKQVPHECIGFIEHLLTVDPNERPSVTEALAHSYLQG